MTSDKLGDSDVPPAEVVAERPELQLEQATEDDAQSTSVWIPSGRTLREELAQPRYLALVVVALLAIALQLWLLY